MNVLITGGTGFIGNRLVESLIDKGCDVTVLTRDKTKVANGIKAILDTNEIKTNEKIDVIINLAGASINKKWSDKYKKELIDSRVDTTKNIVSLIKRLKKKPELLISASAIGYYGSQGDAVLDEESQPKNEFTYQLCRKWETQALKAEKLGVRVCITRLGVVLGKNGGALKQMTPPFKMCLGGKIGSGRQYFSWVHIDDVISAFMFLIKNKEQSGTYNLTAPCPVTNSKFTTTLGNCLKRPTLFPMPSFVVKILFGEMGETLLLKGQRVLPKKLKEAGFKFQYSTIEDALQDIIK